MSTLHDAVTHLANGDWQAAHTLCQNDATELGSWAHGIVHLMEGDRANAGYWYRRAGRELSEATDVQREIRELGKALDR